MKAEHFPFGNGDNVLLLTYANSQILSGTVVGVDDEGVTLQMAADMMRWNPWGSISGASLIGASEERVAEIVAALGRPAPARLPLPGTVDDPPPA